MTVRGRQETLLTSILRREVDCETFCRAVGEAETRCGSAGKLVPDWDAGKVVRLLALGTLGALDGIQPGARLACRDLC